MDTKPDHSVVESCAVVRLASSELVAVDRCNCGTLRVHLGALTLRINAEGLQAIMETLGAALIADAALTEPTPPPVLTPPALSLGAKARRGQS
jgi:hypothetical protein